MSFLWAPNLESQKEKLAENGPLKMLCIHYSIEDRDRGLSRNSNTPFSVSFYLCVSRLGAQRKLIEISLWTPNQDAQLVKLIEIWRNGQILAI